MNKKAVQIKVAGMVQGVFFRKLTREKAMELGVAGNVRNCDDGSVEITAEGEAEQLQLFINWCRRGPKTARVDHFDINDATVKNYSGFFVNH